jgi:hypothetical protein
MTNEGRDKRVDRHKWERRSWLINRGIPRSLVGGRTWESAIDIHSDAGAMWSIEDDGLHAPHCSGVAFSGDDILVSAAIDPFVAEGRVYRWSIRSGGRLVPVEDGMPVATGASKEVA